MAVGLCTQLVRRSRLVPRGGAVEYEVRLVVVPQSCTVVVWQLRCRVLRPGRPGPGVGLCGRLVCSSCVCSTLVEEVVVVT